MPITARRLAWRIALLGNREEAEEVVQEAFLNAWRSLADYDATRGSLRTWF
jgi:DNA-directed RNA polymerase specialized sigma24 family protein